MEDTAATGPKTDLEAAHARDRARTREIAREVLIEAFGASATPFVPVPFVDDWMFARLLRRIAGKVLAKHAGPGQEAMTADLAQKITDAYVKTGAPSTAESIAVGAARFVVRKLAVVMDVKKSHDVFGESIAFALALDMAVKNGWATAAGADHLGAAMHRSLQVVASGAIEGLVRAGRDAIARGISKDRVGDAIGREVEKLRDQLDPVLRYEIQRRG